LRPAARATVPATRYRWPTSASSSGVRSASVAMCFRGSTSTCVGAAGIDVADRDRVLVLVHALRPCLAGTDPTEEAVGHPRRITGLGIPPQHGSGRARSMDFSSTPEQELLRRTARALLTATAPMHVVRGLMDDPSGARADDWRRMAELGWQGLIFPEEYGGVALSLVELAIVLEEMGRVVLPGPFLSTIVAGLTIQRCGSDQQRRRWLPGICDGSIVGSLALLEESASWNVADVRAVARREPDGYVLSGTKLFVGDAELADVLVCVVAAEADDAPSARLAVATVERSALTDVTPLESIDQTRRIAAVTLDASEWIPPPSRSATPMPLARSSIRRGSPSPPRCAAAPNGCSSSRSSTPRSANSSVGRSAAFRRSSTCAPTCSSTSSARRPRPPMRHGLRRKEPKTQRSLPRARRPSRATRIAT